MTKINNLKKLKVNDSFQLHIQNKNKFTYNFDDTTLTVSGFGYYDSDKPKKGDHRFKLELDINNTNGKETLIAIMMNPSNTFPEQNGKKSIIDGTVKNVVRMAYQTRKYSKLIVLNSFALINGKSSESQKDGTQKCNLEIIKECINDNKTADYLLAWGKYAEDVDIIKKYLSKVKAKIFVYKRTKKSYPCHPSIQVENRLKYVSEFLNSHKNGGSFLTY